MLLLAPIPPPSLPPLSLSLTHSLVCAHTVYYDNVHNSNAMYPPTPPSSFDCVRSTCIPSFRTNRFRIYCQFVRSRYNLEEDDPDYFIKAATSSDDWIGRRMSSSTPDGEPSFISAASLLPPSRDYAMVGSVDAHTKFSLSQDGRVRGPTLRKLRCTLALPPTLQSFFSPSATTTIF